MASPGDTVEPLTLPRATGGFHLHRELGRGGMGVVYEALEISSGRRVALKVLLREHSISGEAFERFQREARLAAAISHAHCVFVYGAHEIEGSPAIAMELVGGETLEERFRRRESIPIRTAVRWTLDLLEGLEAAHSAGVLHRDIKPSNCFVTSEGRVKIGDFGLSRSIERDVNLTQSGQFLGSPLYASPEQIRGREFDQRSDLYSCGATLYAILTGQPPYSGKNVGEVLARILSEDPPPPRTIRPEIPRVLERVVLRAMQRDSAARYANVQSFRDALLPFVADKGASVAPTRRLLAFALDGALLFFALNSLVIASAALLAASRDGHLSNREVRLDLFVCVAYGLFPPLYFTLCEGLAGATIGKWLFSQRVVSVSTGTPSFRGAALRSAILFGPTLICDVGMLLVWVSNWALLLHLGVFSSSVVLLACPTARRRNGWRGIHELASGTCVVQANAPFSRMREHAAPPEVPLQEADSPALALGEYAVEGVVGLTSAGKILKARDPTLARSVWIHWPREREPLADGARRNLARPARLRWLGVVRTDAGSGDVFESPGGSSLPFFAARHGRVEWMTGLRMLLELVDELRASTADASVAQKFALEQVWIGRNWDLRLLDHPVGAGPFTMHAPLDLVTEVARAVFQGYGANAVVLPPDLPLSAEPIIRRLLGLGPPFQSLEHVASSIAQCRSLAAMVTRRVRGGQLAVNTVFPALIVSLALITALLTNDQSIESRESGSVRTMLSELGKGSVLASSDGARADALPLSIDERRAREILIVDSYSKRTDDDHVSHLNEEDRASLDAARARHPVTTKAESQWADEELRSERGLAAEERVEISRLRAGEWFANIAFWAACVRGFLSLVTAFACRGGLSLAIFGLCLRNRRGEVASRLLCVARSLIVWVPIVLVAASSLWLARLGSGPLVTIVLYMLAAVLIAGFVHALVRPARAIQDVVVKTRLVPR